MLFDQRRLIKNSSHIVWTGLYTMAMSVSLSVRLQHRRLIYIRQRAPLLVTVQKSQVQWSWVMTYRLDPWGWYTLLDALQVDFVHRPLMVFCRLSTPAVMTDLSEIALPTRFVFLVLIPQDDGPHAIWEISEMGRSLGSMLGDQVVCNSALLYASFEDDRSSRKKRTIFLGTSFSAA